MGVDWGGNVGNRAGLSPRMKLRDENYDISGSDDDFGR